MNKFKLKNKLKTFNGKRYVFCLIRKKYYLLTKEELVRQKIIYYLIKNRGYKVQEIYVEFNSTFYNIKNRLDILVIKKNRPFLIVECKSPEVKISSKSFDQIMKYYLRFKSQYLVLTNGIKTIIFEFKNDGIEFLKQIPKNF
ncbi:type I restriction enzyme HsdR N-terminal domain-containing protein [Candidatus Karelsulcia muelleri]|uniref:type I restriction enzyme HsdR N-terminal domain-containing protein n=1 Tax=Candidatus Karelsulcia muelleri TaxID=336810 RepID=UPI001950F336|nr:type I restriction enzyme HsdR N-terminal domain-containing protein [Candidatus Karelsulcia muelleri]